MLVNQSLGLRRSVASFTALLFTITNGLFLQADHEQLNTIALLPVCTILAIAAGRAELAGSKGRARLVATALAALIGAWLLTSYYLAWFTLWFALVLAGSWAVLARPNPLELVRSHGTTLGVFTAGLVIATLPFLAVYLPKAQETGAHAYSETLRFLIRPLDVVNVGPDNLLWGWLFRSHHSNIVSGAERSWLGGEHQTGFPLLMFAIAVISLREALQARQPAIVRALALAIIVSWLLTMDFGRASPWALVHWLVPGASGLRVVVRYQLILVLPILLLVLAAERGRIALWMSRAPTIMSVIAVLLLLEQLNSADKAELPRKSTLAAFAALPRPPRVCGSFYVVSARRSEQIYRSPERQALYPHNADAMLLAELWRVPTINGFSTFNPPDWAFAEPLAADYDARAVRYARAHGLKLPCRLDARQLNPWTILNATSSS